MSPAVTGSMGNYFNPTMLAANPITSLRVPASGGRSNSDEAIQLAPDAEYIFADGTRMAQPPASSNSGVVKMFATTASDTTPSVSIDTFRNGHIAQARKIYRAKAEAEALTNDRSGPIGRERRLLRAFDLLVQAGALGDAIKILLQAKEVCEQVTDPDFVSNLELAEAFKRAAQLSTYESEKITLLASALDLVERSTEDPDVRLTTEVDIRLHMFPLLGKKSSEEGVTIESARNLMANVAEYQDEVKASDVAVMNKIWSILKGDRDTDRSTIRARFNEILEDFFATAFPSKPKDGLLWMDPSKRAEYADELFAEGNYEAAADLYLELHTYASHYLDKPELVHEYAEGAIMSLHKMADEELATGTAELSMGGEKARAAEDKLESAIGHLQKEYDVLQAELHDSTTTDADRVSLYPRSVNLLIMIANTHLLLGDKMQAAIYFERAANDLNRGPNPANVGLANDGNTYNGTRAAGLRQAALQVSVEAYHEQMDNAMHSLSMIGDLLTAQGKNVAAARLLALSNPTATGLTTARRQLRENGDFLGAALVSDKLLAMDLDSNAEIFRLRAELMAKHGSRFNPYIVSVSHYINALAEAMTSLAFHERYVVEGGSLNLQPGAYQYIIDLVDHGMASEPSLEILGGLPSRLKV